MISLRHRWREAVSHIARWLRHGQKGRRSPTHAKQDSKHEQVAKWRTFLSWRFLKWRIWGENKTTTSLAVESWFLFATPSRFEECYRRPVSPQLIWVACLKIWFKHEFAIIQKWFVNDSTNKVMPTIHISHHLSSHNLGCFVDHSPRRQIGNVSLTGFSFKPACNIITFDKGMKKLGHNQHRRWGRYGFDKAQTTCIIVNPKYCAPIAPSLVDEMSSDEGCIQLSLTNDLLTNLRDPMLYKIRRNDTTRNESCMLVLINDDASPASNCTIKKKHQWKPG